MSQHIDNVGTSKAKHQVQMNVSTVAMLLEALKKSESDTRRALQAVIEGKLPDTASPFDDMQYGYEDEWISERQLREDRRSIRRSDGSTQTLRRHRNGGGWVPLEQDEYDETKPFVAESAYVGPRAEVRGNARIVEAVRIESGLYATRQSIVEAFGL